MKRTLSIFLILIFGLGPFAEALPASAESRLPACCRRHGAHHCDMSAETAAKLAQTSHDATPVLTASPRCPNFPSSIAASTTQMHALAVSAAGLPVLLAQAHSLAASRAAALLSQIRTRAGRAPPSFLLG